MLGRELDEAETKMKGVMADLIKTGKDAGGGDQIHGRCWRCL